MPFQINPKWLRIMWKITSTMRYNAHIRCESLKVKFSSYKGLVSTPHAISLLQKSSKWELNRCAKEEIDKQRKLSPTVRKWFKQSVMQMLFAFLLRGFWLRLMEYKSIQKSWIHALHPTHNTCWIDTKKNYTLIVRDTALLADSNDIHYFRFLKIQISGSTFPPLAVYVCSMRIK